MIKGDKTAKRCLLRIGGVYKEIGKYLKDNRFFVFIVLLCIAEIILFYVLNAPADDHYIEYVNETEDKYSGLFQFIFFENLKSFTITLVYGVVPLFIGSLLALMMTVRGLVVAFKLFQGNIAVGTILVCILPHGIIEIPLIVFCLVWGFLLSKEITLSIIKAVRNKELVINKKTYKAIGVKKAVLLTAECWLLIILPAALLAALIESYVTPVIMNIFLG